MLKKLFNNPKTINSLLGFGLMLAAFFGMLAIQPSKAVQPGVTTPTAKGAWTPVMVASTPGADLTYSVQVGRYARDADRATVSFNLTLGASLSGSGDVSITGLPFYSEPTTNLTQSVKIAVQGPALTPSIGLVGLIRPNTKIILFFNERENATMTATQMSMLAAGDGFTGTFTYLIK